MESESTMNDRNEESSKDLFLADYIPDWAFREAEYNPHNEV